MEATVSFRGHGGEVEECSWASVALASLQTAHPWRTFRWYRDQTHYSGTYWSATTRDHVIYESRLELSRLLFADFDPSVRAIVAQPFLLQTVLEGKVRRHIPDYLLLTRQVPVVVDVKPLQWLSKPEVAFTFTWTRRAVESRGWKYEVWSEPPAAELENIRFLAGYRRDWLFNPEILDALRDADLDGLLLGPATGCLPDHPEPQVRSAIHHLLWTQDFVTDLDRPLGPSHILRRSA
ncbi:TnsA-like heteromeric transposase endonuclease subunit [Streptomyces sp. NPDC093109]|uniref:TnsA-like heteromeric transposase endonuclease subunit n=1 Tax=Streptomyces sp. NPDC093109 TaxID=3154977 RepID=UPI00344FB2EF